MATLRVSRSGDRGAFARRMKVLVDGSELASLRPGEEASRDLAPGPHSVQAVMDWARSPVLEISLSEGDVAQVRVAFPARAYWASFVTPSRALVAVPETAG